MLVDANLLLYAVDSSSTFHRHASTWLESVLNGAEDLKGLEDHLEIVSV